MITMKRIVFMSLFSSFALHNTLQVFLKTYCLYNITLISLKPSVAHAHTSVISERILSFNTRPIVGE